MIRGSDFHINKLILSLLVFSVFTISLFSQTRIGGTINEYGHVNSLGTNFVIVSDPIEFAQFTPNDTVLLIQMKGARIYFTDLGNGTLENSYGKPGKHEFLLILNVDFPTKKITFKNPINTPFNVEGALQIVKVPSFKNSAVVDISDLTCAPWDSTLKTGGVLALIVGKTLSLNKNIDVSGKGFIGGAKTIGTGLCVGSDATNLDKFEFNSGFSNSGFKGESPVIRGYQTPGPTYPPIFPNYSKGKGANFTGGGGGNGRFSGGGGGSNYGKGGKGGFENSDCSPDRKQGGSGGEKIFLSSLDGEIFLGGGGGSSTYLDVSIASPGGNGGGIVIIVCDNINGNGQSIIANGATTTEASLNAGSGGGGAGGSVAISLQSFSASSLTISANGGKGGNNASAFGEGGGGGGGLIKISNITIDPLKITRTVSLGPPGVKTGTILTTALGGAIGETPNDFVAVLNGFLFNSIHSSVSANQEDSICAGMNLPVIKGTEPVGGTGPGTYTYKWEKSYERTFSSPILLINDISPVYINYTPTLADAITPTDSVFFRRTITDSSPTPIVDRSNPVKFTVHPKIQYNNIIADPDSICSAGDPQIIKQNGTDIIFPNVKSLQYIWQDSTVGGAWGAELASHTVKEYDPNLSGGLTVTTWYRRYVKSGSCADKGAGSIVKITVLNKIADNAFSKLNDTICFGGNTNLNTLPGPTGGVPGKYTYEWESSTFSSTGPWTTIAGESLLAFDPDASVSLPVGDHFYRRKVLSGEQNACIDFTPAAVRKVWSVIINNVIKADQTIGYDSIPSKLIDFSLPLGGGSGSYKYRWVKDTVAFPSAPGPNSIYQNDYLPPNLKHTISFKRIVKSSVCSDSGNSVKITVDLPITNSISLANSALDIIYTGQTSSGLNGSVPAGGSGALNDFSIKWYKSTETTPTKAGWTEITGITTPDLNPGILTLSTWFRRDVSSPVALPRSTSQSNYLKVTVLSKIINVDILPSGQSTCSGKRPFQLKGSLSLSGGDSKYKFTWQDSTALHPWQDIPGFVTGDSANYKPPELTADTKYKRIVYSGKNNCGSETSNIVSIGILSLPAKPYAGPDAIISSIEKIYHMKADVPLTGETGLWTVLDPQTSTFDESEKTKPNAVVRNLSAGDNSFLWTVTKETCTLDTSVVINLIEDFIPKGFSPNDDDVNDTFKIEGLNLTDQTVQLNIVNGAGTEVFSTTYRPGQTWTDWNGKNSAGYDLAEGTYYYLLKVTSEKGQVFKKSGFIILKRK